MCISFLKMYFLSSHWCHRNSKQNNESLSTDKVSTHCMGMPQSCPEGTLPSHSVQTNSEFHHLTLTQGQACFLVPVLSCIPLPRETPPDQCHTLSVIYFGYFQRVMWNFTRICKHLRVNSVHRVVGPQEENFARIYFSFPMNPLCERNRRPDRGRSKWLRQGWCFSAYIEGPGTTVPALCSYVHADALTELLLLRISWIRCHQKQTLKY